MWYDCSVAEQFSFTSVVVRRRRPFYPYYVAAGEWLEGIRIRIPLDVFCILETHKSDGDGFDDKSARRHLVFFSLEKKILY